MLKPESNEGRILKPRSATSGDLRAAPIAIMLLVFVVFATMFLASCQADRAHVQVQFKNPDGGLSPVVDSELALTSSEQQLGLMYRKEMTERSGMLFVFPDEKPRSFWMKNTYLELDIIYLSKDLEVVSIVERAVPLTETPRPSGAPAMYVLEVKAGLSKAWGIQPGSVGTITGEINP